MYRSKLTGSLIVLIGMVALLTQPAAADFLEEVHVFNLGVDDPTPDSVSQYTFDLPLFDTANDTRTLIGFRVNYYLHSTYTYVVNENPTADWHGCEVKWTHDWGSTLNGEQWFPLNQASGYVNVGSGHGVIRGPFSPTEPPVTAGGSGVEMSETYSDPALLTKLTGIGTASVDCTHTLSALSVVPPPARMWPSYVPQSQRVFDPNMLDLTVDRMVMDLTLTYYWTPEPSSLALLLSGVVSFLRRR